MHCGSGGVVKLPGEMGLFSLRVALSPAQSGSIQCSSFRHPFFVTTRRFVETSTPTESEVGSRPRQYGASISRENELEISVMIGCSIPAVTSRVERFCPREIRIARIKIWALWHCRHDNFCLARIRQKLSCNIISANTKPFPKRLGKEMILSGHYRN